jgi:hypothetical protein
LGAQLHSVVSVSYPDDPPARISFFTIIIFSIFFAFYICAFSDTPVLQPRRRQESKFGSATVLRLGQINTHYSSYIILTDSTADTRSDDGNG